MSEAVRAALAARRAELRRKQASACERGGDDDGDGGRGGAAGIVDGSAGLTGSESTGADVGSGLTPDDDPRGGVGEELWSKKARPRGPAPGTPRKGAQEGERSRGRGEEGEEDEDELAEAKAEVKLELAQRAEVEVLRKGCVTGRFNLASRAPALTRVPAGVFGLLSDDAPAWYVSRDARPWYERADVAVLQLGNNEIVDVDERVGLFGGLARLQLNNNRLTTLPRTLLQLSHLVHLNLSRNRIRRLPSCLLALPALLELDLSHNQLVELWDDDAVRNARRAREEWLRQHDADEAEQGGVWAGLLRSPSKSRSTSASASDRGDGSVGGTSTALRDEWPLHALRTLDLTNNRLTNASLRIDQPEAARRLVWPPRLRSLDLSDNFLTGPLPCEPFGRLERLEYLGLGGNGLADEVFSDSRSEGAEAVQRRSDAEDWTDEHAQKDVLMGVPTATTGAPEAPRRLFPSLRTLALHRCEIDDLGPLERFFGSPRTIAEDEKPSLAGAGTPTPAYEALAPPRFLVRLERLGYGRGGNKGEEDVGVFDEGDGNDDTAARSADAPPPTPTTARRRRRLGVFLDGNALREEIYRRKRGLGRGDAGANDARARVRTVSAGVVAAAQRDGILGGGEGDGGAATTATRRGEKTMGAPTDSDRGPRGQSHGQRGEFGRGLGDDGSTDGSDLGREATKSWQERQRARNERLAAEWDEFGPLGGVVKKKIPTPGSASAARGGASSEAGVRKALSETVRPPKVPQRQGPDVFDEIEDAPTDRRQAQNGTATRRDAARPDRASQPSHAVAETPATPDKLNVASLSLADFDPVGPGTPPDSPRRGIGRRGGGGARHNQSSILLGDADVVPDGSGGRATNLPSPAKLVATPTRGAAMGTSPGGQDEAAWGEYVSEGAKRRMRAEAMRREREAGRGGP